MLRKEKDIDDPNNMIHTHTGPAAAQLLLLIQSWGEIGHAKGMRTML